MNTHAKAVTPSDSQQLPLATNHLYVGTGGDITLVTQSGETVTLHAVPAGSVLPVSAIAVKVTGTTAANIVALS